MDDPAVDASAPAVPVEPAVRHDVRPPTRSSRAFYGLGRNLVVMFCRLWFREEIRGTEHVPATGPFILAPVHRSNTDTLLVAGVTGRRLRYMGKASLWKYRWSAWLLTALGGFPVHRGSADREALRICREVLEQGEALVMFPEGTRQSGPVVGELFDGPAYLAARMGVPIVPVGIGGSERAMPVGSRFLRPVRCVTIVGPPIHPEPSTSGRVPRSAVRRLSERVREEIQRLFDEAQVAAGTPNPPR
jgi:1-acyl-sn-glycerol-3-phosphate acyltransferase